MCHSYGIGTHVRGKILDSENFANLMNDAHFAKIFPKNACKYGEPTTKDLHWKKSGISNPLKSPGNFKFHVHFLTTGNLHISLTFSDTV